MSGFSAEWLALREPADQRARNQNLLRLLADRLAGRKSVTVVDLGCGTGSNLRAVAPVLGEDQRWLLVDCDPLLLAAARPRLAAFADAAATDGDGLLLRRGAQTLRVRFREADLSRDAGLASDLDPDLIAAAALFDLVSESFIERFVEAVAERGTVFYSALTYNGAQTWTPPHPADAAMLQAFHAHQATDKGFGAAAGPRATGTLASAFESRGYRVSTGESPWRLGQRERPLIEQLAAGVAGAVRETGLVPDEVVSGWLDARLAGATCTIGHTDLLALPN